MMDRIEAFHDDTMGTDEIPLIDQYKQMHQSGPDMYAGLSVMPHIHRIKRLIDQAEADTVLDYGCGKGKQYERPVKVDKHEYPTLEGYWGVKVVKYDPAWPPLDHKPFETFEGVICTDVLEHAADADEAAQIVEDLFGYTSARGFVFASISCREAVKTLPDGRNAHTCIQPPEFWRGLFTAFAGPKTWKIVCSDGQQQFVYASDGLEKALEGAKQALQVKTKNCVSHETIVEQIRLNQSLGLNWVQECRAHDRKAVLVSAGPSWKEHLADIRARYNALDDIYCVKHSHDGLIEAGIIPTGCFLLDPRDHVKDFVENPHPDVRYICASMCHPTTIRQLMEHDARIFLYHARVGAGEERVATQGLLVPGGSCSATRGIVVLRLMGYRSMSLYGYDSCFYDVDLDQKAEDAGKIADITVQAFAENGFSWEAWDNLMASVQGAREDAKKYIKVETNGQEFVTTAELVAAAQDFEALSKEMPDVTFEVYGRGMVPAVFDLMKAKQAKQADFETAFS